MADEQDRAEALDDDEDVVIPPEHPLGAQAYGAAGAEPHADEPVARRAAREEPEEIPGVDDEIEPEVVLDPDDPIGGDATLRDTAAERSAATPAEEAALHLTDEP